MLVTNNEKIFQKAKLLRSHGMTTMSYERAKGHSTNYDVVELGYNYRMDDIRAAIGIAQLEKLLPDINKRICVRRSYIDRLETENRITIPFKSFSEFSASYIFPIVLKDGDSEKRDSREYLAKKGIQTSVHYPPVHRFQIYQQFAKNPLPVTEYVTDCEFTLPMYGALSNEEVVYICNTLKEALDKVV